MVPLILPGVTELTHGEIDVSSISYLISTDLNILWLYAMDEIMATGSQDLSNYANGGVGCNRFINEIADHYNRMLQDEIEPYKHISEVQTYPSLPVAFYNNYEVVVECIHYIYSLMLMRLSRMVSAYPIIYEQDPNVTYVERLESYAVVLYLFKSIGERVSYGLPIS